MRTRPPLTTVLRRVGEFNSSLIARLKLPRKIDYNQIADNKKGKTNENKRLSQQPELGALTFLRSFVAGKANFCSHLLASLVHFTVVKSQAILIIRLGVAEIIYHSYWGRRSYFRCNFISSASFKTTKFLPRWICSGTTVLRVDSAYRSPF